MSLYQTDLAAWLEDHGLVVEGDETWAELDEAYRYMREYLGDPVRTPAKAA